MSIEPKEYDLAVVGAGLAGMAAALFAAESGLRTVQIGNAGALLFSSGLLDLMAVHPVAERRIWDNPWAALAQVRRDLPHHPLAHVPPQLLLSAFTQFVRTLAAEGLAYTQPADLNSHIPTSAGTIKTSYCIPTLMARGAQVLTERKPCLIVGFAGLREFSARQVAETLAPSWPGIRGVTLEFAPMGQSGELYTAHIARHLELADIRAALARRVAPLVGNASAVGFPAVLGIRRTFDVVRDLEAALRVPVFEIPTIPTSVPGLRLKDALERAVAHRGVERVVQRRVVSVESAAQGFVLHLDGEAEGQGPVRARALILATGRFMGGGLVAERGRIREPLLGLPVLQPESRNEWHSEDFFDPSGHPIERAGVQVDASFRPCDHLARPLHPRLFAIGTILAGNDWARMKCGASVALGSARVAVDTLLKVLKEGT